MEKEFTLKEVTKEYLDNEIQNGFGDTCYCYGTDKRGKYHILGYNCLSFIREEMDWSESNANANWFIEIPK